MWKNVEKNYERFSFANFSFYFMIECYWIFGTLHPIVFLRPRTLGRIDFTGKRITILCHQLQSSWGHWKFPLALEECPLFWLAKQYLFQNTFPTADCNFFLNLFILFYIVLHKVAGQLVTSSLKRNKSLIMLTNFFLFSVVNLVFFSDLYTKTLL